LATAAAAAAVAAAAGRKPSLPLKVTLSLLLSVETDIADDADDDDVVGVVTAASDRSHRFSPSISPTMLSRALSVLSNPAWNSNYQMENEDGM
jgi:hypothetical protein